MLRLVAGAIGLVHGYGRGRRGSILAGGSGGGGGDAVAAASASAGDHGDSLLSLIIVRSTTWASTGSGSSGPCASRVKAWGRRERCFPADGVAVPAEATAAPAGYVTSAFQTLVSWLGTLWTLIRVVTFHEPHSALFVAAAAAALREHGICIRRAQARSGARGVWYFKAIACFVDGVQHCSAPPKRRQ